VSVAEHVAVGTVPTSEPQSLEFGRYRILVPDTQHVLSEAAGMTLFIQHLAFGLVTRPNICPSATLRVGITGRLAVLNVIGSDVETKRSLPLRQRALQALAGRKSALATTGK